MRNRWIDRGLIPGPQESEEEYHIRCKHCLEVDSQLQEELGVDLPFVENPAPYYEEPLSITTKLYNIAPDWVPLLFHNKNLLPWHGGCAWIYELTDAHPTSAFLQLRKHFAHKETLAGLYHRNEIIAHEMVHVGRMAFEEPLFEELLAYQTSPSRWRRWWGPLIQAPWEGHLLLLFLVVPLLFTSIALLWGPLALIDIAFSLLLLPFTLVLWWVFRLSRKHQIMKRTLASLSSLVGGEERAQSVALWLTDREIRSFATMPPEEILSYGESQKKVEFRWQCLMERITPPSAENGET